MSEEMKYGRVEIYGFIASKCFKAQGTAKICSSVKGRKAFYNAELLCEEADVAFTLRIKKVKLKNRIEHDDLFEAFLNHPLSHAILYSLLIKTKLIPFNYHKNCIR
jgi:hypothetical protein